MKKLLRWDPTVVNRKNRISICHVQMNLKLSYPSQIDLAIILNHNNLAF